MLENNISDLPIDGSANSDGLRLAVKSPDGNVFAVFRSANGKKIFPSQKNDTNAHGIGLTCATAYTSKPASGYWYDQPNVVREYGTQQAIGVGIPVNPNGSHTLYMNSIMNPTPMLVISIETSGVFQHLAVDVYKRQLQKQLDEAMKLGDKSQISSIKKQIKETFENLTNGIEENLKRINDEIDAEIAEINANRKMTKMQKQDDLDNAERRKYANEANELRKKANQYRKEDNRNGDNKHDYNIKQLEREASLKDKLAEIPSLLDKIHEASTQAFEDGLLNFLERGIFAVSYTHLDVYKRQSILHGYGRNCS